MVSKKAAYKLGSVAAKSLLKGILAGGGLGAGAGALMGGEGNRLQGALYGAGLGAGTGLAKNMAVNALISKQILPSDAALRAAAPAMATKTKATKALGPMAPSLLLTLLPLATVAGGIAGSKSRPKTLSEKLKEKLGL